MNLGRSGLALLSVSRPAFSFSSSTVGVPKQLSARRGFVIVTAAVSYQAWANNRQSNSQLMMSSQKAAINTGYLNAADAAALDAELMSSPGFSLEQLMELAGLSVAEAVYQVIGSESTTPKILLICGPGNNGGDGLVAARHLVHFGYDCTVVYPKKSSKQHFINLVKQCEDVGVEMLDEMPKMEELRSYAGIVDSIFGFSFHGSPREPFATALKVMMEAQKEFKIPVISVDVPSGWNVDEGDVSGIGFVPEVLISLTTPKESSKSFKGRHFVGGRFLPPKLAEKYKVQMPPYPGVSQVMDITEKHEKEEEQGWRSEYQAYLYEKESKLRLKHHETGPGDEDWGAQYAAYCAEKEKDLVGPESSDNEVCDKLQKASIKEQTKNPITNIPISQSEKDRLLRQQKPELWQLQYAEYCAEKEAKLKEEDEKEAKTVNMEEESWQAQYAAHCIEKEKESAKKDAATKDAKSWEEEYAVYCKQKEEKMIE